MHRLRFRQVHLDFHTSPAISGIGAAFDAKRWQDALRQGHVDSITTFAKCHHGWSYHATRVGKMHPHLGFDLLRAQYDAAKAIDVNVPIYISAGLDEMIVEDHADWQEHRVEGPLRKATDAAWRKLCFNGPYLDYLCAQIEETVSLFPDCDGIFLDIIAQGPCVCPHCLRWMDEQGLDGRDEEAVKACAEQALTKYYEKTTAACKSARDDMPVFHNSGHIDRGRTGLYEKYFSHLELESLPTGGWGYDHFPLSAKYCDRRVRRLQTPQRAALRVRRDARVR